VVGLLIDALDENGYLAQDLNELAELLPAELDITLDDLETALVQLQHLDQPGLGARNLGECLALQLKALPEDTPQRDLAIHLVSNHLEALAAHDYARIKKLLRCTDDELRAAQHLIVDSNPKPGAEFDRSVADYVVPDVIVEKRRDKWLVRLNAEAMPKLRVNQIYANILQQRDGRSTEKYPGNWGTGPERHRHHLPQPDVETLLRFLIVPPGMKTRLPQPHVETVYAEVERLAETVESIFFIGWSAPDTDQQWAARVFRTRGAEVFVINRDDRAELLRRYAAVLHPECKVRLYTGDSGDVRSYNQADCEWGKRLLS